MAKKKLSRVGSLRDKISSNDARSKRGGGPRYLSLPSGVSSFIPEVESTYTLDFMMYAVKMKTHPDRDDKNEVAVPGAYWYKLPYKVHRDIGVGNEKVVCPRSFGKPCPICEMREKLRKEDGDEDEMKALNTSDRALYVVRIHKNKKWKDDFYIFDASVFKFHETFKKQLKADERWYSFMHPTEGCSVKIVFDEATFAGNKYAEATRFDFVEREEQYEDEILDEVPVLDDCLTVLSYEQLKAKFFEAGEEEDEEEEKPRKKTTAPETGLKKKPVAVVEEEDEDEDEEESLDDQINALNTLEDLLALAKENPDVYKAHLKTLKTITKWKLLRVEMLSIANADDDDDDELPFKGKEKTPSKKQEEPVKRRRVVEEEDEDEDEEEEPAPKKKVKEPETKSIAGGKCPHGHKFGKDNDEYEECDDCELWNACYKKQKES